MKVLLFDTETTGLPKEFKTSPQERPNNWPHIVDIAWILLDTDTNKILQQKSFIIRPDNWTIPLESTAIHGIYHAFATSYGAPLEDVIKDFFAIDCDMYIAHNIKFDENVIMNAVHWDIGGASYRFNKPMKCTMNIAKGMCKLPFKNGGHGYKPPKLSELYEHVFHEKPIQSRLHGAMYDTQLLTKIVKRYEPIRIELGLGVRSSDSINGGHSNQNFKDGILYL
jgi:DNA polymerase III epsilon subunit-like protein